jgi:uncharacterized protein (DUF169 family)
MSTTDFSALAQSLKDLLGLAVEPIAIAFSDDAVAPLPKYAGSVPAGCVFWMHAADREVATDAADHANCSVGSLTHGFKTREEAARGADVAALVAAEWVAPEALATLPALGRRPRHVLYGPLARASFEPDLVLLRLTGKQLMLLHEAVPDLHFHGKPQCHIIPLALETGAASVSTGCMLSRVRTGMSNNEMICAIPARALPGLVARLATVLEADRRVATYAAAHAKRFSGG